MPEPTHQASLTTRTPAVHSVTEEITRLSAAYGKPVTVDSTLRIKSMFGALDERPARVAEVAPDIQRPRPSRSRRK